MERAYIAGDAIQVGWVAVPILIAVGFVLWKVAKIISAAFSN